MIKSCQIAHNVQRLPFMGNPKHIVIHALNRTLANYNEASFNMAKDDVKQSVRLNSSAGYVISDYTLPKVTTQL